jgi:hypothetical protein
MGDVTVGHQEGMVTDHRFTRVRSSPIDGDRFTYGVMVANDNPGVFSPVLEVLGDCPYRGKLKDGAVLPDLSPPLNYHVGTKRGTFPDGNLGAYDTVGPDLYTCIKFSAGINNGGSMDHL